MLLLALDTSTRYASIALCSESECYGEYSWHSSNNHSIELLEYLQRLCTQAQVSLQQLDLIAVATGPGSFTGVRVALATAKALAFSLQKPLIGVSTLDIIAYQQRHNAARRLVCALLEAGRAEVYAACYLCAEQQNTNGELTSTLHQQGEYQLLPLPQLVSFLQEHASTWLNTDDSQPEIVPSILFCGEISPQTRQTIYASLPQQSVFIHDHDLQVARQATSLAMLALQLQRSGQRDDPLTLEPLYLRRPTITKSTRKQPLLGETPARSTDAPTTEREKGALRH
jgi:tRNA threonylcarbamoyladenosine biosynthesis protein TsaB